MDDAARREALLDGSAWRAFYRPVCVNGVNARRRADGSVRLVVAHQDPRLPAVRTPGVEALGVVPESFLAEAEPVEWMAEAALALCTPGAPTGRIALSGPLLEELGRAPRTLDGSRPLA